MRRFWQPGSLDPTLTPRQGPPAAVHARGYDYIVLTAAITRPDLHARVFPDHLKLIGSARVLWLINVDDVGTGHSVDETIGHIRQLIAVPNVDVEFLRAEGRGCFFQAARRLILRAGELLAQCRTGVVWLEDDWVLARRTRGQDALTWLRYRVVRNPRGRPLRRCLGTLSEKQALLDAVTVQQDPVPGIWSKALFTRAMLQTMQLRPADAVDDPETICADPWNQGDTFQRLVLFIDPAYQDAGRQWSAERGLAKWQKSPDELAHRGSVTYGDGGETGVAVSPRSARDALAGWLIIRRAFATPLTLLGRITLRDGRLSGRIVGFPHVTFDLRTNADGSADIYLHRIHRWSRTYPYKKIKGRVAWRAQGGELQVQTKRGSVTGRLSRSMPLDACWLAPLQAGLGLVYYSVTLLTRLILFDANPKNPD
jgi:hypothetical protein